VPNQLAVCLFDFKIPHAELPAELKEQNAVLTFLHPGLQPTQNVGGLKFEDLTS